MTEKASFSSYRPSKTLWFWSCAGCAVATMIVGFTVGGWVTGGSAEEMAVEARETGRASLAARICVDRFLDAPDADTRLVELQEQGNWQRNDYVEDGGWTTFADMEEPIDGAADLCAEQLAEMEVPAASEAASAEVETATN